jgi:hypothetical protein
MRGFEAVREAAHQQLESITAIKGEKFGKFVLAMITLHQATLAFTNTARQVNGSTDDAAQAFIHCLEHFTLLYADEAELNNEDIEEGLKWAGTIFHGAIDRLEKMSEGGAND